MAHVRFAFVLLLVAGFSAMTACKKSTSDPKPRTDTIIQHDTIVRTDTVIIHDTVTPSPPRGLFMYSAVLMGAQNNAAGSFFSSETGITYPTTDSANFIINKVDVSFAQIGPFTTVPKLISLSERRNEDLRKVVTINRRTLFKPIGISSTQFDTASINFMRQISQSGTASIEVAQGYVYAFISPEGKRGLIRVSNIDQGTGLNGSVTIDVRRER